DLSLYRLRSDSGGLKSTAINTLNLTGILQPGHYFTVQKRTSGEFLSLTNSGGQIWLQDVYGVVDYDVYVSYPDASLDSKKGFSWAYDLKDSKWKWMNPAPNMPNYWEPANDISQSVTFVSSSLTPCK